MTEVMNAIVRAGLIAGSIGGEAMILLVLVNTLLLKSFATDPAMGASGLVLFWGVAYPLIIILVFEGGGIFSSWLCRAHIRNGREALIAGAITGITTGIILEILWIANILSLASNSMRSGTAVFAGAGSSVYAMLLLIVLVVMGSTLSAFGSYIYSVHIFRCGNAGTFSS